MERANNNSYKKREREESSKRPIWGVGGGEGKRECTRYN